MNYKLIMSLEIITWLKDGKYRIKILKLLNKQIMIPSEIADKLNLNRASVSRILKQLKEKELVKSTSAGSRTISYEISKKGIEILENGVN